MKRELLFVLPSPFRDEFRIQGFRFGSGQKSIAIVGALSILEFTFRRFILGIYTTDPHVVQMGMIRITVMAVPYFLCGMMDVMTGVLRGIGYSLLPMCISLGGICLTRVIWLATVFRAHPTMSCLMLSHPVSWVFTLIFMSAFFFIFYNRLKKDHSVQELAAE